MGSKKVEKRSSTGWGSEVKWAAEGSLKGQRGEVEGVGDERDLECKKVSNRLILRGDWGQRGGVKRRRRNDFDEPNCTRTKEKEGRGIADEMWKTDEALTKGERSAKKTSCTMTYRGSY